MIKYLTAFFMIALFSLAVINYMVGFANDNNAVVDISDDEDFSNYTSFGESIMEDDYVDRVNLLSGQYTNSTIDLGSETTRTGTTFKEGGFTETYGIFKGVMEVINEKVFGTGSAFGWVLTAFAGFLLIIFGLLSWKVWKGGNPE